MKRSGFKRPELPTRAPVVLTRATRTSTYAGGTSGIAVPRQPRLEYPHLLLMAREVPRPCLLRVPGLCRLAREDSCCACHGNGAEWNKGGSMKAHDFFSVWGCARCHGWLDSSYSASGEERALAFRAALDLQIEQWAAIARAPTGRPKDIEAAAWAVDNLILLGYAAEHPSLYAVPTHA